MHKLPAPGRGPDCWDVCPGLQGHKHPKGLVRGDEGGMVRLSSCPSPRGQVQGLVQHRNCVRSLVAAALSKMRGSQSLENLEECLMECVFMSFDMTGHEHVCAQMCVFARIVTPLSDSMLFYARLG